MNEIISERQTIYITRKKPLDYSGGSYYIIDVSENKVKEMGLLDSGHSYHYIIPGLNIKSKCNNNIVLFLMT